MSLFLRRFAENSVFGSRSIFSVFTKAGFLTERATQQTRFISAHSGRFSSTSSSSSSSSSSSNSASSHTIPENTSFFYSTSHDRDKPFRLSKDFVLGYKNQPVPFGFNGLGELVYLRTYSRLKEDGSNEQWFETVERVVNGTYNMQKRWIEQHGLGWNARRAQRSAQEMYSRIFSLKFLPPGRGLWAMGSPLTEERGLYAALNNCAFVSTENLKEEPHKPFSFLMDASMLGVGVGFDTKGAGSVVVKGPNPSKPVSTYIIPDSREGWVESLAHLIDSYFNKTSGVMQFDYSKIRPKGLPIRGFGGVSSGPGVLEELHSSIRKILDKEVGQPISVTGIVDIMNVIGRCVVAGNVRRTAEIAFGDPESSEFLDLKNYVVNPQRAEYGWTSNNSVFARLGMDYKEVCKRVQINGEPGFAWLDNMQAYGLMDGLPNYRDFRAMGGNPCLEQTLESYELCCLVETFPTHHEDLDDFCKTLKYAYLYAKTVTLGKTHWPETNRVMLRNRRIGCSMSGIAQFVSGIGKRKKQPGVTGIHELRDWCTVGYNYIEEYDKRFSDWLAIPRSIKTTSIKPSGTVSLLAGVTPGMHYPESRFYIRRVRLSADSNLIQPLKDAGYNVVPAVGDEKRTLVVEFPIDAGEGIRSAHEVSMWEQLGLAAFLQRYWSDNQVSATITFDPATEGAQLSHALDLYQYQLKGISFLPRVPLGAYPQMPYEDISHETYLSLVSTLRPVNFQMSRGIKATPDMYCDSTTCSIDVDPSSSLSSSSSSSSSSSGEGGQEK